ncbi:MAG: SMP-30/gluconolactonase/LRE family protein [Dehalococcoidia bacterium]
MKTTTLAEGFQFGEGPRWHDGRLWLSDFYDHAIKTVDANGRVEVQFRVPTQPSGLGWLPDGRLLTVSMLDRKVLRQEGDRLVEHADVSSIATFHCNDMVVDAKGRAYVGNFGFDLHNATPEIIAKAPAATMARVDPDGTVHVAAADLAFPNGTVITPDGKTLIVGETMGRRLTAFDIAPDGSLSNRRLWADCGGRLPDGICLDAEGCVWIANPRAPEAVRIAEGGEVRDVVETSLPCFAVMLGGEDGKTLFCVTAAGSGIPAPGAAPTGKVEVARVAVGHAGLP